MENNNDRPLKIIEKDNGEVAKKYYQTIYKDLGYVSYKSSMEIMIPVIVNGDQIINVKFGNTNDVLGSIVDVSELGKWTKLFEYYNCTLLNYSILPTTGGLNNIKRQLGNDRIDTFIYALGRYYQNDTARILNAGSEKMNIENRALLKYVLDSFGSVYGFCRKIYGITNRSLINRMTETEPKAILEKKDLGEYLMLAVDIWEYRFKYMIQNNIISLNKDRQEIVSYHFKNMREGIESDLIRT